MRIPFVSFALYGLAAFTILAGSIAGCQMPLGVAPAALPHAASASPRLGSAAPTALDCKRLVHKGRKGPPHNDEPQNGLTAEALLANKALLDYLAQHALSDLGSLTDQAVLRVLAKDDGIDLTKYVVSCALNPCQAVTVNNAKANGVSVHSVTFSGELGLCDGSMKPDGTLDSYGDWYSGKPSASCTQAISACVLARVNAHHKKVVISLRDPNGYISIRDDVPVETEYREGGGTPIPSFATCNSINSQDCGWSPQYVGVCGPGEVVLDGLGSSAEVRVCKGLYGCEAAPTGRWYSSQIPITRPTNTTIKFSCPFGLASQSGYYSVMVKKQPLGKVSPYCDGAPCAYPAKEQEVFTFQEGAFFGDIFDGMAAVAPSATPLTCPPPIGLDMLSGHQYACYSDNWEKGIAYLADRLCAGPYSPCFANPPGKCKDQATLCVAPPSPSSLSCSAPPPPPCHSGGCTTLTPASAPPGQKLYDGCYGTASQAQWSPTMTVYLNSPCDLATDLASCSCANPDAACRASAQSSTDYKNCVHSIKNPLEKP